MPSTATNWLSSYSMKVHEGGPVRQHTESKFELLGLYTTLCGLTLYTKSLNFAELSIFLWLSYRFPMVFPWFSHGLNGLPVRSCPLSLRPLRRFVAPQAAQRLAPDGRRAGLLGRGVQGPRRHGTTAGRDHREAGDRIGHRKLMGRTLGTWEIGKSSS